MARNATNDSQYDYHFVLLRLGHIMDVGFEQIFLMLNSLVRNVGDVFETFVYQKGLVEGN